MEEVDELIGCRYDALFNNQIEKFNKVKFEPLKNFLLKFKLAQVRPEQYAIESFEQVGLPDPFGPRLQTNDLFIKKCDNKWDEAYPDQRMHSKTQSPVCLYLPTTEIMTKMILACIGVTKVEDLWFY